MFSALLYKAGEILIKSYARLMLEMDIRRKTELPDGPVLYAANHPSTTDPIFMHLISPHPLSVMITSKVFSIPVLGAYMRRMRQIAVVPGQGERVLEEARQTLAQGRSVMIFPEGLISPPGDFHAPRSGVARLALKAGVPVVPLGISLREENCKRVPTVLEGEPDVITWYLRGPYAVTIGKPLWFQGDADDRSLVRAIAETVMQHIRELAHESRERLIVSN
ncbi:MAG: 1-acyl-sn-glycerol-3-phosphate acyltransferase [Anaerolineales bacterium]|nr:1-acyl-sn-glycerol-3-phosphate acyltransferase [Anaerolineales bacterium]